MDVLTSDVLTGKLNWNKSSIGEDTFLFFEEGEIRENLEPYPTDYLAALLQFTQEAIEASTKIPQGTDYSIQVSNSSSGNRALNTSKKLTSDLLNIFQVICPHLLTSDITYDNVIEKFSDCIDFLLSKVDIGLSVFSKGNPTAPVTEFEVEITERKNTEKISDVIYNNTLSTSVNHTLFVPFLTTKPFAIVDIPPEILAAQAGEYFGSLPHPYFDEIEDLNWENPKKPEGKLRLFDKTEPQVYLPLESTPLVWVTTEEDLDIMIQQLNICKEIAFDIEHHSRHSYRGITCLIQCSTRTHDFIIDPLILGHTLVKLNQVTTNPGILKVFHGAESDIIWLQRDFSVYVVNLFDTCKAARALAIPGGASLLNLLDYYCGVTTDKSFQLADWRIRPLPQNMISYARKDTHFLLYIFDKLKLDILKKPDRTLLRNVLERSRNITLKIFTEPNVEFDDEMVLTLVNKYSTGLLPRSFTTFQKLLRWRDTTARKQDCPPGYILPTAVLIRISEQLPQKLTCLMQLGHHLKRLSYSDAREILRIIQTSEEQDPKHFSSTINQKIIPTSDSSISYSCNNVSYPDVPDVEINSDYFLKLNTDICPLPSALNEKAVIPVYTKVIKSSINENNYKNADAYQVIFADFSQQLKICENNLENIYTNGRLMTKVIQALIAKEFDKPKITSEIICIESTKKRLRETTTEEEEKNIKKTKKKVLINDKKLDDNKYVKMIENNINKKGKTNLVHTALIDNPGTKSHRKRHKLKLQDITKSDNLQSLF